MRRDRSMAGLIPGMVLLSTLALLLSACGTGAPTTRPPTAAPTIGTPTAAPTIGTPTAAPTPAGPATFSPEAIGAPETAHVRIGSATVEANNMLPQFALDEGLYEKYGLTAEVITFGDAQQALQAVVAGQVDILTESPQVTITSMTTENPLVNVATFTNKFLDCIVTSADVTDAASATGKRWAVSSLGGQSHAEVIVSLKVLGLTSADVSIIQVGGQSDRVAALQAGSVDAIPVDCATGDDLVAEGFNNLLTLSEQDVQFPGAGIQANQTFAEANPNTVAAVVAVNLEAMQLLFTDQDAAVASFMTWGQVEEADAVEQIDQFKAVAQRDFTWTVDGLANVLEVQAEANPEVADIDPNEIGDTTYLDRLVELGIYDALEVPSE